MTPLLLALLPLAQTPQHYLHRLPFDKPERGEMHFVSDDETGDRWPAQWLDEETIVWLSPRRDADPRKHTPVFGDGHRAAPLGMPHRVSVSEGDGKVSVFVLGELVTEYRYRSGERPYFYPVLDVTGTAMTRRWPVEEGVEEEERDHPHHHGMWFTHGAVNGLDFWHAGERPGRIVLREIRDVGGGNVFGGFTAVHDWLGPDGELVATDERIFRAYAMPERRFLEHDIRIHASEGPLLFGDTKEGSFAFRVRPELRLRGPVAAGAIVNSAGVRGSAAWGKRAAWVDYSGPIDDTVRGVAVFDHPGNLRHPCWWHARDYGLLAANPFGAHDFEGAPAGTGDHTVSKGETLRLRYAVYLHPGKAEAGGVAGVYGSWSQTTSK